MSASDQSPLPPSKQTRTTLSPWEARLGYHRAVRRGPFIFVSGTTALRPIGTISPSDSSASSVVPNSDLARPTYELKHPGNAYGQTLAAFAEAMNAVAALGGTKADVVRVRMYVARQTDVEGVGGGFSEMFGSARHHKRAEGGGGAAGVDPPDSEGQGDEVGGGGADNEVAVAATMVVLGAEGGGGFVDPGMLVEVEVDAVVL